MTNPTLSKVRLYREFDWATQRWDWFNSGRIVEPKSFCQFWRTVLLYVTIKQLLAPIRVARGFVPSITIPGPKIPQSVSRRAGSLLRSVGRGSVHGLWLLAYSFRLLFPPVGRAALAGVVNVGEPIEAFVKRNGDGLRVVGIGLLVAIGLFYGGVAILLLVLAFLANWFWTLAAIGGVIVIPLAFYGLLKSGFFGMARDVIFPVLDLLWDAAVTAKHGVCPPVRIVRE